MISFDLTSNQSETCTHDAEAPDFKRGARTSCDPENSAEQERAVPSDLPSDDVGAQTPDERAEDEADVEKQGRRCDPRRIKLALHTAEDESDSLEEEVVGELRVDEGGSQSR